MLLTGGLCDESASGPEKHGSACTANHLDDGCRADRYFFGLGVVHVDMGWEADYALHASQLFLHGTSSLAGA